MPVRAVLGMDMCVPLQRHNTENSKQIFPGSVHVFSWKGGGVGREAEFGREAEREKGLALSRSERKSVKIKLNQNWFNWSVR